jgi:hypothetical protein
MFCPKCGGQNPDNGKFCRSCGTDLGNVSSALAAPPQNQAQRLVNHKGKPIHWEGAIAKLFTGLAFLAVAIALAFSGTGRGWWFWMLIPAFGSLGTGVAQYMQLRRAEKGQMLYQSSLTPPLDNPAANRALSPQQQQWAAPESRYKTGDLVPPSVAEGTTRHLEIDKEGQTMALPEK